MKHTLVCTLPNLKEKPLPVLDETLELTFKEGWNGHAYGPMVGYLLDETEKHSLIKTDTNNGNTKLLDQLLADYDLIQKDTTIVQDNMLVPAITYHVPYKVKDHIAYQPTVHAFVDNCSNLSYTVTYELLFVSEENYERHLAVTYKTAGTYAASLWSHISNLEDTITEWIENNKHGIQEVEYSDSFVTPFYDNVGDSTEIEFANAEELLQTLASIRLIGFETEEIKSC